MHAHLGADVYSPEPFCGNCGWRWLCSCCALPQVLPIADRCICTMQGYTNHFNIGGMMEKVRPSTIKYDAHRQSATPTTG
jgi:hypothetical protein